MRRSCWCASRGPSCSTAARAGPAARSTRRPSCSSRSTRRRRTCCSTTSRELDARDAARADREPPRATRSSSRRWSRWSRESPTARSPSRRRSRRCSRPASTSSTPTSATAGARRRSRARSSTAARVQALAPDAPHLDRPPHGARAQGARPARSPAVPGRGRVPLPPSLDQGRGVRRAAEGRARRPARAFRGLARARGADLVEHDEIVGYHLEQAYRSAGRTRPGRREGARSARRAAGGSRPPASTRSNWATGMRVPTCSGEPSHCSRRTTPGAPS